MRRDGGFTLLEMLVALVVFGLVMAGIAQTFRFGLVAWRAGPARVAEPENLAALDTALTRMIAEALPSSMTGRANAIAFTTGLPPGAGLTGRLADIGIELGGGTLVMHYRPHAAGIPLAPLPPVRNEILAENVTGFRVGYYGGLANGAPGWTSKWQGPGLPLLVRLHIQLKDGRNWPDLVAAPVTAASQH